MCSIIPRAIAEKLGLLKKQKAAEPVHVYHVHYITKPLDGKQVEDFLRKHPEFLSNCLKLNHRLLRG